MTAPLAPPRDVRILDVRATNISVSWLPPDEATIIGDILGYQVRLLIAYSTIMNIPYITRLRSVVKKDQFVAHKLDQKIVTKNLKLKSFH